jgi:hypothetical protein
MATVALERTISGDRAVPAALRTLHTILIMGVAGDLDLAPHLLLDDRARYSLVCAEVKAVHLGLILRRLRPMSAYPAALYPGGN